MSHATQTSKSTAKTTELATVTSLPAQAKSPENKPVVEDLTAKSEAAAHAAVTPPTKRQYTDAKSSLSQGQEKSADVLRRIVLTGKWDYVEANTPEALFKDFLGDYALPGKSVVRNEIILSLIDSHGKSYANVAAMLNMSKPGVQYVVKQRNDALALEASKGDQLCRALEALVNGTDGDSGDSGDGNDSGSEDTAPTFRTLKIMKADDVELAVALLRRNGIEVEI